MSIYITGDLHGDFTRISDIGQRIGKGDYLIALGDVGLILESKPTIKERVAIGRIKCKGYTFVFISGNHDNEDRLNDYPISEWCGGKAHIISRKRDGTPSIVHMMRGQVYSIENKRIFAFGGSEPHEKNIVVLDKKSPNYQYEKNKLVEEGTFYRVKGVDYWESCLASEEEMQEGLANLCKVNYSVDYVITHCAPTSVQNIIYGGDTSWTNRQTEYLQRVAANTNYNKWLFAHYHCNCKYENGLFQCVYDDVVQL